jgi:hypothetical protein
MRACVIVVAGLIVAVGRAQLHVEVPFTVGNERGEAVTLVIGVDERATNGIDALLGEYELPPFHPPQDVFHAVLRFYDTVAGEWKWSYRDFRPLVPRDTFSVEHRVLVQWGGGDTLRIRWAYPLAEHVDSVLLTDRVTGNLVRIRFDAAQQAVVTNKFLEEFLLRVWYRFLPSAVQETPPAQEWEVVCLYDLMGRLWWRGRQLPSEAAGIAPGLYCGVAYSRGQWHRFLWWQR